VQEPGRRHHVEWSSLDLYISEPCARIQPYPVFQTVELESGTDFTEEQLAQIEEAIPAEAVAGSRYAEAQMAHLDSER